MSEREFTDEDIERAAKAGYEARSGNSWELLNNFNQDLERSCMRRALAALKGAGDE